MSVAVERCHGGWILRPYPVLSWRKFYVGGFLEDIRVFSFFIFQMFFFTIFSIFFPALILFCCLMSVVVFICLLRFALIFFDILEIFFHGSVFDIFFLIFCFLLCSYLMSIVFDICLCKYYLMCVVVLEIFFHCSDILFLIFCFLLCSSSLFDECCSRESIYDGCFSLFLYIHIRLHFWWGVIIILFDVISFGGV